MKRLIAILLVFLTMLGCSNAADPEAVTEVEEERADLWIVMDSGGYMRDIVSSVAEEYEGLTIEVESLPGGEDRTVRLEQLRVQIMAGKGPDLYIMDTSYGSDAIFSDISLAMKNGLFTDISGYYDGDTALEKDTLAETVMDAGVYGDARYVLPLRYNFPIAYVNTQSVDPGTVGTGLNGLAEAAENFGSQTLVTDIVFFQKYFLSFFPEIIDYENETVTLDAGELSKFLNQYRDLNTAIGNGILSTYPHFSNYTSENEFWAKPGTQLVYDRDINYLWVEEPYAMYLGSLNDLVANLRIAGAEGIDVAAVPMTAQDGSLTAAVTYCGAVGANCKNPELAYDLLSQLLLKENQWNNNLSCYADGWPVYAEDAWAEINADIFLREAKMGQFRDEEKNKRRSALRATEMTEADFVIMDTPIDSVRFPLTGERDLMEKIDSRLNPARNPDAGDVDVAELAEEIIWELQWHLAEG